MTSIQKIPAVGLWMIFLTSLSASAAPGFLNLQKTYNLDSSSSVPESATFDLLSQSFFSSAFFGGQITRIPTSGSQAGNESVFFTDTSAPIAFFGVKVDLFHRVLYACGNNISAFPTISATIYEIKIEQVGSSGTLIRKVALPGNALCNDLAVDLLGTAYVTDSYGSTIYKLPRGASTLTALTTSPQFTPGSPGKVGLNGIDFTPDHSHLIVSKTDTQQFFSISLKTPTDIRLITATSGTIGNPADPNRFPGPDGIHFVLGKLYVASNGAVQQFTFQDSNYSKVAVKTDIHLPLGLSAVMSANGKVYALKGDIFPVLDEGQLPPSLPFQILEAPLADFQ